MTLGAWFRPLSAAVLAAPPWARPWPAKPPVWSSSLRAGRPSSLVGSVHLLPAGLDWRPPELDAALGKAEELWFELPITPATDDEA